MKKNLILVIVLVLVVLGAFFYQSGRLPFMSGMQNGAGNANEPGGGAVAEGHRLGQAKTISGVTITPLAVTEDSRCAEGVQCVWAGTVKVSISYYDLTKVGYQEVIELGKSLKFNDREIKLASVSTGPDYKFVFEVKQSQATTENPGQGGCYVGGCSSQICSDEPGSISTCEWTEAYACYQTAKCERQSNGQCGWTQTAELKMCLQSAK